MSVAETIVIGHWEVIANKPQSKYNQKTDFWVKAKTHKRVASPQRLNHHFALQRYKKERFKVERQV